MVTDSLSIDGGSSRVALTSAVALAERDLPVTLFAASSGTRPTTSKGRLEVVCTDQGDLLTSKRRIGAALRGLWNVRAHEMLHDLLRNLDPARTVVHVHGWTKALSASIFDAASVAGFPVVVTLHEFFSVCPTGSLYLHKDRAICALEPMSLRCVSTDCDSRSYSYKLWRVTRQAIQRDIAKMPRRIDEYITVSEFSRNILTRLLPPEKRLRTIRNPVDVGFDKRVPAEDNRSFVFVGRLSPEKGPALFAAAARDAGVPAIFIGDGEQRDEIRRINPGAEMIGWADTRRVFSILQNSRALVFPSLWYETHGLVVLEAAAFGVPSVVPSGTAAAETVEDGATGLHFDRGSATDLAEKLRMLSDDGLAKRLSVAAYERYWADPHTMEKHVDDLLGAYRNILAG